MAKKGVLKTKEHREKIRRSMLLLWEMRRKLGYRFTPEVRGYRFSPETITGVEIHEKLKSSEEHISAPENDNSDLAGEKGEANG